MKRKALVLAAVLTAVVLVFFGGWVRQAFSAAERPAPDSLESETARTSQGGVPTRSSEKGRILQVPLHQSGKNPAQWL